MDAPQTRTKGRSYLEVWQTTDVPAGKKEVDCVPTCVAGMPGALQTRTVWNRVFQVAAETSGALQSISTPEKMVTVTGMPGVPKVEV